MADEEPVETTAEYEGRWDTERYRAEGGTELGQVLYDTGILYLVNVCALHRHGLAIGVEMDDGKVTGINLHRTDDPDGIWFDEGTTKHARRKLAEHGLILSPKGRGLRDS